ncbi:MAG: hypothetical protein R6V39_04990, partial [Desulfovibrionales bacterium]
MEHITTASRFEKTDAVEALANGIAHDVKAGWFVDRRDKLTRQKRWQQEDEDTEYSRNDLDRKVVNSSQIRNIIREYKRALKAEIFPNRI